MDKFLIEPKRPEFGLLWLFLMCSVVVFILTRYVQVPTSALLGIFRSISDPVFTNPFTEYYA
jgi:hypothetical protein